MRYKKNNSRLLAGAYAHSELLKFDSNNNLIINSSIKSWICRITYTKAEDHIKAP